MLGQPVTVGGEQTLVTLLLTHPDRVMQYIDIAANWGHKALRLGCIILQLAIVMFL
jgi:hypothetical protein